MCGIAGWFEVRPKGDAAPLAAMLRAMTPRGPDDQGQVEIQPRGGGWLMLGCRRLAILDLSPAGHQPMHDPVTGNCLVFNGEIYNFGDLRRELQACGCQFRSNCDTEVLLLGYRVWGETLIERLRGMFAFAVWDEPRQTLLLVRDRHGIKPLYYLHTAKRFLFASELRALLASGLVERELDPTGMESYLKFGAVQEPATLCRGIRLLKAAHLLRWSRRSGTEMQLSRYWKLPHPEPFANGSAEERPRRIEHLSQTLSEAVEMRLISDVPVGIFLSGGLDSSVVTALAARRGSSIQTFNVTFAEKPFAEGAKARRVAQYLGTEHHELSLSERDLLADLPEALAAMDQPTVDGINTFFVSRAAKQAGATVALSGLGGDELFGGYRSFRVVPLLERADRWAPRWTRRAAATLLDSGVLPGRRDFKLSSWLRGEDGFGHPFYFSRLVLTPPQVACLVLPDWLLQVDFEVYRSEMEELERLLRAHDPINRVSCLELSVYLRNTLLRDTDCMSMAHSLEVRVPLLDHVVTEQMLLLPGDWKLNGRQRKPLLVGVVDPSLPVEILRQPKIGFEFPWTNWMRGELRNEIEPTLTEPGSVLNSVLDWEVVRRLWRDFLAGRLHWSRVWLFYVLRKWCDRHLAR
jgi:asparagine synthase (glutamine-hydrolysing)